MDNGLIWLTILFPVVGAILQTLVGKALPKRILGFLAVLPIALAFGIGVKLTMSLDPASASVITSVPWIHVQGLSIPFELRIDSLSMLMVLIITGIGSLIHLYATGYMAEEKDYGRFFAYLNLFVASMLLLVLGNNLLLLFVGWEGVGLCSYLLIGFWYEDVSNSKAANKAFIVNRIGDWGLTLGLFMIAYAVATDVGPVKVTDGRILSYDTMLPVLQHACLTKPMLATTIGILLFVGACGKSAQFPLYLWLPDAMAGPTPVSALIHAATMVTSGVVLLNRMHVVYEQSNIASIVVVSVGAFTALFAAIIAFGQTDIKKVLAYSTVSQLGFMFVACGAGAYWVGMFHVTTHAFFKALLFLGSGAVIHAMAHDQDMRNYGKLAKYIPITCLTMVIGWFAIAGVPGLSGFYSKDRIIVSAIESTNGYIGERSVTQFAGYICLVTALLTACYMTRMMFLTFFGKEERWRQIESHDESHGHSDEEHHHGLTANHKPHEVPVSMWFPLVILAVLSAGGGWFLEHNERLQNWLKSATTSTYAITEGMQGQVDEHMIQNASIAAAVVGILIGAIYFWKGLPKKQGWNEALWPKPLQAARDQFGYDTLMVNAAVDGGNELAVLLDENVDRRTFGGFGIALGRVTEIFGAQIRALQSGLVRVYALTMLIGVAVLIAVAVFYAGGVRS